MKSAIITGGGSGIGAAVAVRLVKDGWQVTINGRTKKKLEKVKKDIGKSKRVHIFAGDVSNPKDVEKMIKAHVKEFGGLDGLINNAGVAVMGGVDEVKFEDWKNLMSINVDGMFHTITNSKKYLEKSKGAIVNVSSVSGLGGDWNMWVYNTSKGAVSNLTRALALDLAAVGVRVNAVAPSLTDTDMAGGIMDDDKIMKRFKRRIPMGRAAKPEEVAAVIAFLLSEDARFVNGVILPVDGGLSASNGQPKFDM